MPSTTEILNSIQASGNGLTLAELLARHPGIARRTAQRLIAKLIESSQITASGEGRARRYFGAAVQADASTLDTSTDSFPSFIPLSADSRDILTYINQPTEARKPELNSELCSPGSFIAMPSIAYRLARVAAGDGDAGVSLVPVSAHDVAAGHALLIGAGGVLVDQDGTALRMPQKSACRQSPGDALAAPQKPVRHWSAETGTRYLSSLGRHYAS
jgi:hypothetical protein